MSMIFIVFTNSYVFHQLHLHADFSMHHWEKTYIICGLSANKVLSAFQKCIFYKKRPFPSLRNTACNAGRIIEFLGRLEKTLLQIILTYFGESKWRTGSSSFVMTYRQENIFWWLFIESGHKKGKLKNLKMYWNSKKKKFGKFLGKFVLVHAL
jgi:hypothetical protein